MRREAPFILFIHYCSLISPTLVRAGGWESTNLSLELPCPQPSWSYGGCSRLWHSKLKCQLLITLFELKWAALSSSQTQIWKKKRIRRAYRSLKTTQNNFGASGNNSTGYWWPFEDTDAQPDDFTTYSCRWCERWVRERGRGWELALDVVYGLPRHFS